MAPCFVFAFVEKEKMLYMLSFSLINIVLCGVSKFVRQERTFWNISSEKVSFRVGALWLKAHQTNPFTAGEHAATQWLSTNQANKRVMIEHMSAMITAKRGTGGKGVRESHAIDARLTCHERKSPCLPIGENDEGKIWCKYVTPEYTFERIKNSSGWWKFIDFSLAFLQVFHLTAARGISGGANMSDAGVGIHTSAL